MGFCFGLVIIGHKGRLGAASIPFRCLPLGPLYGAVGLIPEDEFPFISVSSTFFVRTNALPAMGTLLVTLPKIRKRVRLALPARERRKESAEPTRRFTARQFAQLLETLVRPLESILRVVISVPFMK